MPVRMVVGLLGAFALGLAACGNEPVSRPGAALVGDVRAGEAAMETYGCSSCHVYPGAGGDAASYVGPPLERWSQRSFIAGYLPNNQPNLVDFIMDPDTYRPGTAMPNLGVVETDARDIAAYLLSL